MIARQIELINVLQWQVQEVMLVLPPDLRLSKFRALVRSRRRVCDLGNEIRGRCFCDTVHEHADEGGFNNDGEGKGKTKQHALAVLEPAALLLGCEWDAAEVGFKLILSDRVYFCVPAATYKFAHQAA